MNKIDKINNKINEIEKLIAEKEKIKKMNLLKKINNGEIVNMVDKINTIVLNDDSSNDSDKIKKEKILKIMKMRLNKNMELEIKPILDDIVIEISNNNNKDANEYTFDFDKNISVNKICITNVNIPKNINNISNKNNELKILFKNKYFLLCLEPDYYNRYDIVENLNDNFDANEILISCSINKNDEIIFSSSDNENFDMLDTKNSILNTLGFINGSYKNEDRYVSNYPISLSDNIYYLGFMNLYDEPLFKINMDADEITLLVDIDFNNTVISELLVKFYFTPLYPILNQKYEHFYKKHSFNIVI